MVYVMLCPKCKETVTFFDNEESKTCRKCNEVVYNTNSSNQKYKDTLKDEEEEE